jgi:hypothetical protein
VGQAFAHVINANFAIFVEIEAQPVVTNKDVHIAICVGNIFKEGGLFALNYVQEHANKVGNFINIEHNSLIQLSVGLL